MDLKLIFSYDRQAAEEKAHFHVFLSAAWQKARLRFFRRGLARKENEMSKTLFRLATITAILLTVMGSHTTAQAASSPVLGTSKIINLAYFYKPPEDSDAPTLAHNFSTFILTRADEPFRDQLIANGVQAPVLQYVRIEAIMDPGSCSAQPYRDNVAYKIGDFCTISQDHPDWFLLNADGSRIKVDGKYFLMDPGNQEWREFWLSRTQESQEQLGWYGVFLDNVEGSLSKVYSLGGNPVNYPNDASYQAAIRGFLQYIYTSYFQPQGRPLLANIISLPDAATWFDYLQYLDGAMDEAWAVDWHTGYRSVSEWNADLALAEQTQNNGKYAILISQGDQSNTNRQSFAFASYLLISSGRAAFRYTNYDNYGKTWLYPNYDIDLGSPLGPRYPEGNLWKRDFTNGSVTVDPVNHTAQISTTPAPTATPTQPPATQSPEPTATPTEPPATQTPEPTASPTQPPATQTPEPTASPTQPPATQTPEPTASPTQPPATQPPATQTPEPTASPTAAPTTQPVAPLPTETPAPATTTITYDNTDPAFVYSTSWSTVKNKSAYNKSFMRTTSKGSSVTFTFTGQSFSILYTANPKYGNVNVYVDGVLVGSFSQQALRTLYQQRWDYPGQLTSGTHELKLVFNGPKKAQASLDGVIVTQTGK